MIEILITVAGGLALFLYGMKIMSEGLQATTGERLKNILWKATHNRIKGVLTGFCITAIIQSSSAATIMLVSFVNAGLIDLMQAAGIILGANIGTTVTGWVIAIAGTGVNINFIGLTAIAAGFFIRFIDSDRFNGWTDFILGFGLFFLSLTIMNNQIIELRGADGAAAFFMVQRGESYTSILILISAGTVLSMALQSSSAVQAVTMLFCINSLINIPAAAAVILGANLGTTITANIAALRSPVEARKAARIHFLFKFFGVLWMLAIFKPLFIPFSQSLFSSMSAGFTPALATAIFLAGYHSAFNIVNVIIFLPFLKNLARAAELLVRATDTESTHRMMYITTNVISTPSININQARLEIQHMAGVINEMYDDLIHVMITPDKNLSGLIEQIILKEDEIDRLEKEISTFLVKVSREPLSKDQSNEITSMLHKVNELENIGDQCESILKQVRKKYDMKLYFSENGTAEVLETSNKVKEFLQLISLYITSTNTDIMEQATALETRIDELKKELRNRHIQRLNDNKCEVDQGIIFIDIISALETIGDHCFNLAETISGIRIS